MKAILLATMLMVSGTKEPECQIHFEDPITGEQGGVGWMPYTEAHQTANIWRRMSPKTKYTVVCRGEFRI
jgi:hypothetical protein